MNRGVARFAHAHVSGLLCTKISLVLGYDLYLLSVVRHNALKTCETIDESCDIC